MTAPSVPPVPTALLTERLRLRRWIDDDRVPFAALNADAEVMRHFPSTLDRAASDAMIDRIEQSFDRRGLGLWAVELRDRPGSLGFIGLAVPRWDLPITTANPGNEIVEVGWRLARSAWGRGLAPEGARAVLDDGFGRLGLHEIVSFTGTRNLASQRVMQKLGMTRDPEDDFDHPALPDGHELQRHVLFRLRPDDPVRAGARLRP